MWVGAAAHNLPALPSCLLSELLVHCRRFFEASAALAASWDLQNQLRVGAGAGAATALSWRQAVPGLPPMLLVGTSQAGAQIWLYQQARLRWEQAATLSSPEVCIWHAAYCGWLPGNRDSHPGFRSPWLPLVLACGL